MPGLNELMKVVKVIAKDDPNLVKGINDFFLKINNSSIRSSQPITENTSINSDNINPDNINSNNINAANSDSGNMTKADKVKADRAKCNEKNRKEDILVGESIPSTDKPDLISEIFKYELDNDKLIEGMIYTEVFGTPLSKRRGRHGRAR